MRFIFSLSLLASVFSLAGHAQTIGTFNSVQPSAQTQNFVIPSTHTFQRIIKSGDALSLGGNLGSNLDFTGYVPIGGSSNNGYLSISSETTPAEVSVLSVSFSSSSHLWSVSSGGKVALPFADLGNTSRFCSGTVTPDNTVIVAEEATTGDDANGDGYQDLGWLIEINPATRTVINQDGIGGVDKLWAVGRQSHENCVIQSGETAIYWGADANPTGYMYKFVPTTPGVYTSGTLYVLVTTVSLGNGTWVSIPNTSPMLLNNTVGASTSAGAFNFDGIEDVEIGPDGKIYFAAKGPGVIYRFTDNGLTVSNLEVFVNSVNYDVDGAGPFAPEPWGIGNDNLAFDGQGNLWVLQDGDRNHIWVVGPSHTPATPSVRLFAKTPAGSEPTGITFSPDYNFMFISFQHPNTGNTSSQTDASGVSVVFNTHTTVVIARKEFLGAEALPVHFLDFKTTPLERSIKIDWQVTNAVDHAYFSLERSVDNIHFSEIYRNNSVLTNSGVYSFNFIDQNVIAGKNYYYRVKQCDKNGKCHFSMVRSARLNTGKSSLLMRPVPAYQDLTIQYYSSLEERVSILIHDQTGRLITKKTDHIRRGYNDITLNTARYPSGNYLITLIRRNEREYGMFVKL